MFTCTPAHPYPCISVPGGTGKRRLGRYQPNYTAWWHRNTDV